MRTTGRSLKKTASWVVFCLMALVAFLFSSIPMMSPSHPLHSLLYSQRWLLYPHIAAGLVALVIGPLQFSSRFRTEKYCSAQIAGQDLFGHRAGGRHAGTDPCLELSCIFSLQRHDTRWRVDSVHSSRGDGRTQRQD